MRMVDRAVVIIRPKQSFVDWINSSMATEEPVTIGEQQNDLTAILIPEFDSPPARNRYLAKLKPLLFEMELASWNRDPATWPQDRSVRAFNRYLEIEVHSMVWDTVNGPITHESEKSVEEEFQLLQPGTRHRGHRGTGRSSGQTD
jgi:hypothetical protein